MANVSSLPLAISNNFITQILVIMIVSRTIGSQCPDIKLLESCRRLSKLPGMKNGRPELAMA
jgi:hypothetical protein